MQKILDIISLIDSGINDDPPGIITAGGIIKDGYNAEVDRYRKIIKNSKDWLAKYQEKLILDTGISKLRIKYTNVGGYFIEVSKAAVSSVASDFVHKQTLVNAVRFITPELKEFEKDLVEGESVLAQLEYDLFGDIRNTILEEFEVIKDLSTRSGYIDFGSGLAEVSYINNYCRPELQEKYNLEIKKGRHPVIEQIESDFISNNLSLDKKSFIHTITGPNMGGKSTFLRQNALIIILAHLGSFVPATSARISLTDKLFSRVGATDNLYLGQSTFMVEMQEIANILNNSTKNSFIIIDEVGRGTSTFDGMSLAWAILKENHDSINAKTLFATHYHELIDESKSLKGVQNFSVAVGENDDNIVFLRKIIPGGMKKSYGLEVAKLAGVPKHVLFTAKDMLLKLESMQSNQLSLSGLERHAPIIEKVIQKSDIENKIKSLDIDSLTPLDALNILEKLKKDVK